MTPEEKRARDVAYQRQCDEYQQAFDPMGQHQVRASLTDPLCSCPGVWAGIGQRPACTEHEQAEEK